MPRLTKALTLKNHILRRCKRIKRFKKRLSLKKKRRRKKQIKDVCVTV